MTVTENNCVADERGRILAGAPSTGRCN